MGASHARKRRKLSPPHDSTFRPNNQELSGNSSEEELFTIQSHWNAEQDYENRPRVIRTREKEYTRLPIKTAEGRVEPLYVPDVKDDDREDSFLESEDDLVMEETTEIKEEKPKASARQRILEAKEELARIASLINEAPEEHVNGFKAVAHIASSANVTIKKLALATQLAIYNDVIPGYRIRPLGEESSLEKVSKEVKQLRSYEQSLVISYQNYIQELSKHAKLSRGDVSEASASLASVAIACACALLLAVPHFNFRSELITILVDKLSGKRVDKDFNKCRETIEILFREDEDGNPSLDAVTSLTRMMKARDYRISESALNTFLHLRLLSEFSFKGSQTYIDKAVDESFKGKKPKVQRVFRTKKERKILKERKVVQKQFEEADAIVSREERDKMQAESLKLVFVTYFRILKNQSTSLTGAVLEGLAKYAHLINQDFFGDLLEALRDLTARAEAYLIEPGDIVDEEDAAGAEEETKEKRDAIRESLLCTITAFALLEGQDASKAASVLSLDLKYFISYLYRILYPLSLNPDIELSAKSLHLLDPHAPNGANNNLSFRPKNKINVQTTIVLLLRSLSSILLPPASTRSVPPLRVAAFTKQLLTTSLHLPEKSATAMLALVMKVTDVHGRKIAGMWNTEERKGDGVFDPLRADLEGSNPFASTVWEGELLRLHFCPGVRDLVKGVEKGMGDVNK
ncbi:MAG: hypothetical protein MMC33_010008 [Icmadophila ericetorum]|nr:hypothetical protein [Icmadophila ericetorum]